MATYKIMLVEDDNNLRAIYGDRLMAEGYEIVAARDGEEALALAVKEKPDLIISDVMMPKISGFDMLDILRTTPETKDVKVIMMTALSQAEDKARADKLGADKYLVKSQVTLEDVARVVHEVLGDGAEPEPTPPAPVVAVPTPAPAPVVTTTPAPNPFTATVEPAQAPQAMPEPTASVPTPSPVATVDANPVTVAPQAAPTPLPDPVAQPVAPAPSPEPTVTPVTNPNPVADTAVNGASMAQASAPEPTLTPSADPTGGVKRVIQPINNLDPNATPKIYELYEKEMADQAAMAPVEMHAPGASITPQEASAPDTKEATTTEQTIQPLGVASEPVTQPPQNQPTANPTTPGSTIDPNSIAL